MGMLLYFRFIADILRRPNPSLGFRNSFPA